MLGEDYYDKLVQQDRVDALFKPIEKGHENHLQEIEELKFLFKNCCYNENRLMEEINRTRSGFNLPDHETAKKIVNHTGIKKIVIPTTMWADILTFEFHAFVINVIRCCNFLTLFKLRNVDEIKDTISIGSYYQGWVNGETWFKKIRDGNALHDLVIKHYQEWIKKVNDIRNELIHEQIIIKIKCNLIFEYERISEDSIKPKGDVEMGIPEYEIVNIENYVHEISGKLESFIKEFFEKFGKL